MHWVYFVLVVFSLEYAISAQPHQPKLTIPYGEIEGSIGTTVNHKPFYKFEGVPYAKPPVADLRFEPPQDLEPWSGVWKANTPTTCMQYDHFQKDYEKNYVVHGDEDCLYVNIYTPKLGEGENLDVLVYIHGGAFMFGNGLNYGPEIILDRDVVYVNFNYRLGPLGFLSTEDEILPGNIGLRDQIKALQWVKQNIQYFGGNPESITIFGLSAGGASTHFHYFTPESKGLFKAGLSQSGCMLNPWVLAEHSKEKTERLANLVGCPTKSSEEIVRCLKAKPAKQIVQAVESFQKFLYNPFSPFGVVVDGYWSANPVLPDHPYRLLQQGRVHDVPWIVSYTTAEGLYPASDFYADDQHLIDIDTKWNEVMPFILHYNESVDPELRDEVSREIKEHYLGESHVNRNTYSILVKLMGDRLFITDIEKAARLHASVVKSEVYMYNFNYRGSGSFSTLSAGSDSDIGVCHGDDTILIVKVKAVNSLQTKLDKDVSKILIDTFTSVMKNGEPNVPITWKPLSKNGQEPCNLLQITKDGNLKLLSKRTLGQSEFWNKLPFHENDRLLETNRDEL